MSSSEASTRDAVPSDAQTSPGSAAKSAIPSKNRDSKLPLSLLLVLGCVAMGLYAALGGGSSREPGVSVSSSSTPAGEQPVSGPRASNEAPDGGSAKALGGNVRESIQVANYTYLRVAPSGGEEFWAAVTKTNVPEGSHVSFEGAELMNHFSSKELGRTFERIYFARLSSGAALDPKHGGAFPAPTKEEGHAAKRAASMVAEEIPVQRSVKVAGPLGHTVEGLYADASSLKGQKVRVRATVVRVTRQVMGTNFLHVRDGSGDASRGTHDLVLKLADEPPKLGEEAQFEGALALDVDLGSGYSYPLLLEESSIVRE